MGLTAMQMFGYFAVTVAAWAFVLVVCAFSTLVICRYIDDRIAGKSQYGYEQHIGYPIGAMVLITAAVVCLNALTGMWAGVMP
jgi:hypothetical protein